MKDITRFRGVLDWYFLNTIDQEKVDYLHEMQIILDVTYEDSGFEDFDKEYREEISENSNEFERYFIFNMREYEFNRIIFDDIYSIINEYIKINSFRELKKHKTFILMGIRSRLTISEKIAFLKQVNIDLPNKFDVFDEMELFFGEEKRKLILSLSFDDYFFETFNYYLSFSHNNAGDYFKDNPNTLFNLENPVVKKLYISHKYREMEKFILNEIRTYTKLSQSKKSNKGGKVKTSKAKKPLYQVLFIDTLRHYNKNLSDQTINKCLNYLTGFEADDFEYQRDKLRDLVSLSDIDYAELKANKLGEIIHDITGKDEASLRRSCAVIFKDPKEYTKKQRIDFAEKEKLIKIIHDRIKSFG